MRDLLRTGIGVPVGVLAVLAMVVLPLPPMALDVLFTFNIALSLVIVMAVFYVSRPVEFGVFPTVLLLATLLRLALNVASTRVVLLNGHTGPQAAGHVIQSFGEFVIGGNFAVGVVVFIILTIINFVVVTKGAGRISEVSARFTLDAMPGKQMAIDADLNAGLITQDEARARRARSARRSRLLRLHGRCQQVRARRRDRRHPDSVHQHHRRPGHRHHRSRHADRRTPASTYTLLTIGDGLVTQIPALLLSTAVAIIVTRMSRAQDMGGELRKQLFGNPKALGVAAGLLGAHGPHPGHAELRLPAHGGAVRRRRLRSWPSAARKPPPAAVLPPSAAPRRPKRASCPGTTCKPVDLIGLEVGYRLVPLVDKQQSGDLLARVRGVRRKLSQDLGFLIPAVHIRDNLDLAPNVYRINLARRAGRREHHLSGPRAGDQSGPRVRPDAGHRDARSGLRHGSGLDRARRSAITRRRSATRSSIRAPSSRRI